MTLAWWPQDVNQNYLRGSYREAPDVNVARFQPDVGPPKLRRRMSISTDKIDFTAWYSSAEYAALLTFFKTTLKDGVLPFTRTRRRTGATEVFVFEASPSLEDFAPGAYKVAIALRSLPGYAAGVQVVGGKDSFTKLLLHLNAATGITDALGNTVAASGNAQISTGVYRFGGASLLLDGTGDYLTVTNVPAIRLGSSDFAVEAWVYLAANSTNKAFIGNRAFASSSATEWAFATGAQNCLQVVTGATLLYADVANPMSLNTWHHVAWTRSGSANTLFVDGVSVGTFTNSQNFSSAANIVIGHDPNAGLGDLNGSVDEVRMSIGAPRWTTTFLPGTEAYS